VPTPNHGELASWLTDTGALIVIATGALGFLALITRARPVRWIWRTLISDPVSRWQTSIVAATVGPVVDEMARLSGQLVDHMGAAERLRSEDIADRDRRQAEADRWRDQVRGDVATIKDAMATKADVRTVHRRIDTALTALAAGNPEIRQGLRPSVTITTPDEFDVVTAPIWSAEHADLDPAGDIVVDMGATTFCDSSGVGALVHLAQRGMVAGGTVTAVNVGAAVQRTMRILHISGILGLDS